MSRFRLFRNRTQASDDVRKAGISKFIENHVSSTEVYNVKNNETIKAVLTRNHKEGVSETLLFTYPLTKKLGRIEIGDYVKHKAKTYLTMQEYDIPLSEHYLKYNLLECNVVVRVDDVEQPAAYFGSQRSYNKNKTETQDNFHFTTEDDSPVIITTANKKLNIGTRFIAAATAFKVTSIDKISVKGIYAMSVKQDTINQSTDDLIEDKETAITPPAAENNRDPNKLLAGEEIEMNIIDGYVHFTPSVKIISRTRDKVIFIVPFDITELEIRTKDSEGDYQIEIKGVE